MILHANGTIIDGIDLIVPSMGQTFLEEMNKYRRKCQPLTMTRTFKTLQDGSQVSVVLKRRKVYTEDSFSDKSGRYIVELS